MTENPDGSGDRGEGGHIDSAEHVERELPLSAGDVGERGGNRVRAMNPAGGIWQGEFGTARPNMNDMRAWTASAIRKYYLNPEIVFLNAGHRDPEHARPTRAGYYVAPYCDPDCCQAFGGISKSDFGPFLTPDDARAWSVKNMAGIT
jgi:hypothetical protein